MAYVAHSDVTPNATITDPKYTFGCIMSNRFDYDNTGAFFAGLAPGAVLHIEVIFWTVANMPPYGGRAAQLGRLPPPWRPHYAMAVQHAMRENPHSGPASSNDDGTSFLDMVSSAAKALSFVPGPVGQIASAAGMITDVIHPKKRRRLEEAERPIRRIEKDAARTVRAIRPNPRATSRAPALRAGNPKLKTLGAKSTLTAPRPKTTAPKGSGRTRR